MATGDSESETASDSNPVGLPRSAGYRLLVGVSSYRAGASGASPLPARRCVVGAGAAALLALLACLAALSARGAVHPQASRAGSLQQAWGAPWSTPCSAVGSNCTASKCCQDGRMKCFYKDPGWAECKLSCSPGVNFAEPKFLQTPWSCQVAGSVVPTPSPTTQTTTEAMAPSTTLAPPSASPLASSTVAQRLPRPSGGVEPSEAPTEAPSTEVQESEPGKEPKSEEVVSGPRPSLLCLSLMLPFGGEVSLIRSQLAKGVGIFGCNSWTVYSNESVEITPGPPARILAQVIPGSMQCPISYKYELPTALNSEIFFRFWKRVFWDRRYLSHDWTAKLDPDAVLIPSRLRAHLQNRNPSQPQYINNCDEGLHGPIEAISRGGMQSFSKGLQRCHDALQHEWMTYGEDVWLRRCLGMLGVSKQDDYGVLYERACKPYHWPMPCVSGAASFHPLKTPQDYFNCLGQAKR